MHEYDVSNFVRAQRVERFRELLSGVEHHDDVVTITRGPEPVAVVISTERYWQLQHALERAGG